MIYESFDWSLLGVTSGSFYDGSQANLNYAWSIDIVKSYIN